MSCFVTIGAWLRRLGLGVVALVVAATAALAAPAAPANAGPAAPSSAAPAAEFPNAPCTLDIIAPRLNPGTRMVEAPAMVACQAGTTVNRIDLQVYLLKGDRSVAARLVGHSQPGNLFYGPLVAAVPCNSGDGKWRTFAAARVYITQNGVIVSDEDGGYNPLVELAPVKISC